MGRRTSGIGAAWFGVLGTALLVIAGAVQPEALWRNPFTWAAAVAFVVSAWLILRTWQRSRPRVILGDGLVCESVTFVHQLPGGGVSPLGEGPACRLKVVNEPIGGWAEATVEKARAELLFDNNTRVEKAQWMHEEQPWLAGSGRPPKPPTVDAGRRALPADGDPQYLNILQRHPTIGWMVQDADGSYGQLTTGSYKLTVTVSAPGMRAQTATYDLVVNEDSASMERRS